MSDAVRAYVPIDRQAATAGGGVVPADVTGTALEADLSGFTALTESLAAQFGEQRGAEELAVRLDELFDQLVAEVHRFGGTVLGFSGDAFTTWFDGDAGLRAATCAHMLQARMAAHATAHGGAGDALRLKVAVATGHARRFLVGDPARQVFDGLAGALVDQLAEVEHHARPGQIVLTPQTAAALGDAAEVEAGDGDVAVLTGLRTPAPEQPWSMPPPSDGEGQFRPWVHPVVYARLTSGQPDFLAELRPAVAVFVRFLGIEFENDPSALASLDVFIRRVQAEIERFDGTLVQLTIGDKGSYLYAAFGAPVAHEDDAARAVRCALAIRRLRVARVPALSISIGVASGRLRAGAYGGSQRRTFGVLGDAVNLSARLMQLAGDREVVATAAVREATAGLFRWQDLGDITVRGKAEPVRAARLLGAARTVSRVRHTHTAFLGRDAELAWLLERVDLARRGSGGIVCITAEAGLGKTTLLAEMRRRTDSVAVESAECPSLGVNGSYVVWRRLWHALLRVDNARPAGSRVAQLAAALGDAAPHLAMRAPLLGPLLGLDIADNELTRSYEPKLRKTALEATLVEWLRVSLRLPTMLVLDDCHWIDALSDDLLLALGRVTRDLPLLLLVAMRPRADSEGGPLAASRLPQWTERALAPLSDAEVNRLVDSHEERRGTTYGSRMRAGVIARAEGNPFFVGELLAYADQLGAHADDDDRIAEMPSSLQSLILSRIDRLQEPPRVALKVASVVGRTFALTTVDAAQPELGGDRELRRSAGDLTSAHFIEPATGRDTFTFNHAITQDVAYATLAASTRAQLHARIGRFLEVQAGADSAATLDLLAYHFARGDDDERRRRFLLQAAAAAQASYANSAAIDHYRRALPVLSGAERCDALLKLGHTLELTGDWPAAHAAYLEARGIARDREDDVAGARGASAEGDLLRREGRYEEATALFDMARATFEEHRDLEGTAHVLHVSGTLAAQRGDRVLARERYLAALDLRRELGDRRGMAASLNGLGIVAEYDNDMRTAAALFSEALDILTELDDRWAIAALTSNVGNIRLQSGDAAGARPLLERAVALQREVGDPALLANFLCNLGNAARDLGDTEPAWSAYSEALRIAGDLGDRWLLAYLLEDVAVLEAESGHRERALTLASAGARLHTDIGAPRPESSRQELDRRLAPARLALSPHVVKSCMEEGHAMSLDVAVTFALRR